VEEKRGEHFRCDQFHLHNPCHNNGRQWIQFCGDCEQYCWLDNEQRCNPDSKCRSSCAGDYNAAIKPNSDGGTDSDLYGGSNRNGTLELPVEEEWDKYLWSDQFNVYDACNDHGR